MIKHILRFLAKLALSVVFVLGVSSVGAMLFEFFLYDFKGASVVKITKTSLGRSGGTGFAIKAPSGKPFTLTNAHICQMGNNLVAHKQDGETQNIKVIEIYEEHDLCIMEAVEGLRPLSIAKSIELHERVWLIGHPALRGLTLESGHFVGITQITLMTECSAQQEKAKQKRLQQIIKDGLNPGNFDEFMQLLFQFCTISRSSQHINNIAYGGNSGSPVINKFGNVVGVLFAGRPDQPTASHTVPLEEIHKFLEDK